MLPFMRYVFEMVRVIRRSNPGGRCCIGKDHRPVTIRGKGGEGRLCKGYTTYVCAYTAGRFGGNPI